MGRRARADRWSRWVELVMAVLVKDQFLSMVALRCFHWPVNFTYSEADQKQLIEQVFQSRLCRDYPPSLKYQMQFLKHVMKEAEDRGHVIADEVYELYASVASQPESEGGEFCFRSYNLQGEFGYVTLKESTHLISQGTTGLLTWQAAFHFVEWAMENRHHFHCKRVLELGSGLGFAGIGLCCVCKPKTYCFTDCHPKVLEILQQNVELNMKGSSDIDTEIVELDWTGDLSQVLSSHRQVDCIVATDVVYDTDIIDAFITTILHLMRYYCAVVYVASTIRNAETYKHFCSKLDGAGISRMVMKDPGTSLFYYTTNQPVEIVQLRIEGVS